MCDLWSIAILIKLEAVGSYQTNLVGDEKVCPYEKSHHCFPFHYSLKGGM